MDGIGLTSGNPGPVSIVRDATPPSQSWTPLVVLGSGLLGAAVLVLAAVVVRRRGSRPRPRTERRSELDAVAGALRIGRAERRAVRSLAELAGVREPAVLLLSEHAFDRAAKVAHGRVPAGAPGLIALRSHLGFGSVGHGEGMAGEGADGTAAD